MIGIDNTYIVGNNQSELEAFQTKLSEFSTSFIYSITENDGPQSEVFPFKMLVEIGDIENMPSMVSFVEFLQVKINEVNQ